MPGQGCCQAPCSAQDTHPRDRVTAREGAQHSPCSGGLCARRVPGKHGPSCCAVQGIPVVWVLRDESQGGALPWLGAQPGSDDARQAAQALPGCRARCLWEEPRHSQGCPLAPCRASAESFKIQYLQFLAYTKTPQYKANLQQLLDQEKVRGPRLQPHLFCCGHLGGGSVAPVLVPLSSHGIGFSACPLPAGEECPVAGHCTAAVRPLPGPEGGDQETLSAKTGRGSSLKAVLAALGPRPSSHNPGLVGRGVVQGSVLPALPAS